MANALANEASVNSAMTRASIRESIFITNGLTRIGNVKPEDNINVSISDNKGHQYQKNSDSSEVKIFVYKVNTEENEKVSKNLMNNQMTINDFSASSFSGNVSLNDNQLLFTTIPYDKGWHVYENGTELKTVMVANAFVGVDAGAGEHTLVFRYIPEGFVLGLIISIISLIIFVIVCISYYIKKNKYKSQDIEE